MMLYCGGYLAVNSYGIRSWCFDMMFLSKVEADGKECTEKTDQYVQVPTHAHADPGWCDESPDMLTSSVVFEVATCKCQSYSKAIQLVCKI